MPETKSGQVHFSDLIAAFIGYASNKEGITSLPGASAPWHKIMYRLQHDYRKSLQLLPHIEFDGTADIRKVRNLMRSSMPCI